MSIITNTKVEWAPASNGLQWPLVPRTKARVEYLLSKGLSEDTILVFEPQDLEDDTVTLLAIQDGIATLLDWLHHECVTPNTWAEDLLEELLQLDA